MQRRGKGENPEETGRSFGEFEKKWTPTCNGLKKTGIKKGYVK